MTSVLLERRVLTWVWMLYAAAMTSQSQDACKKQLLLQTEVGQRYELGQSINPVLNELPLVHPGARYLRALVVAQDTLSCNWGVVVRDKQYRAMQVFVNTSFDLGRKWTKRIEGDVIYVQILPCSNGTAPSVMVQSYIAMPLTASNPYYSFQDESKPANRDLFGSAIDSDSGPATSKGTRELGDNVAFVMASYNKTSWVCSGVMIRQNLLLTNWHCGGVAPLGPADYWNDIVVKDMFADISWDGDQISREYTGVQRVAFSEKLDYALIRMTPLDPSDSVLPVRVTEHDPEPGEKLVLIHHTEGLQKQISTCQVERVDRNSGATISDSEFPHLCDTEKGSSGSPVFNWSGVMVGLHHAGFALNDKCRPVDHVNKAIKMSRILADLHERYPDQYAAIMQVGR